jgi:hypothetical protein
VMGEERVLAELLQLAGNTVAPSPDGLERIRARIAQSRRPWWRRALAHLTRKNGVPGWTPGTPDHCNTDGWKEPTMSHDLIREGAPAGRQMAAALALFKLLEANPLADVPGFIVPNWRIDSAGRLHGHVHDPRSDTNARAALKAFAEFLGLEDVARSQGRNEHSVWVHLSAAAEYRGVQVNVWTHVDVRPISPYASFEGRRA